MVQDAVIRNIEIIGQAARNIELASPQFCAEHPEVPWATIYAMRNRVAHGYFLISAAAGLFVDPDDALLDARLASGAIDLLQLHGRETPQRLAEIRARTGKPVMKAIKVAAEYVVRGVRLGDEAPAQAAD